MSRESPPPATPGTTPARATVGQDGGGVMLLSRSRGGKVLPGHAFGELS